MGKLFIGNMTSSDSEKEFEANKTVTGPDIEWFGGIKEGEITFATFRNKIIKEILEVEKFEELPDKRIRCYFKTIKPYKKPLTLKDILSLKYFELNLTILNQIQSMSQSGRFFEFEIKDKYKDVNFRELEITTADTRNIYISTSKDKISEKKEGDIFITVSDENDGYQIKSVEEYDGKSEYNLIDLKKISGRINIQDYGLQKALETDDKFATEQGKKKQKGAPLRRIINKVKESYYTVDSFKNFYSILLVDDYSTNNEEVEIDDNPEIEPSTDDIDKTLQEKNIIFYGAPGCGKSYEVKRITENKKKFVKTERILFHPEYSYSDFIGSILPKVNDKNISYEFEAGPFTKILAEALKNQEQNYCLVIEEINRGNAAAIFGDIFQLMDRRTKTEKDKDGFKIGDSEYAITNDIICKWLIEEGNVSVDKLIDNKKIYIPHNLSIYATMNSSDQNVFVLDTAFKRRWNFKYIPIEFDEKNTLAKINIPSNVGEEISWRAFVEKLNEKIPDLNGGINGDDKQIGQYFVSEDELNNIESFSQKIFLYLWEDVARTAREELFKKKVDNITINTLQKLIYAYQVKGLRVFQDGIFNINNNENEEEDETEQEE